MKSHLENNQIIENSLTSDGVAVFFFFNTSSFGRFWNLSLLWTSTSLLSIKMLEYLAYSTVLIWSWNQSIRTCPSMERITYIFFSSTPSSQIRCKFFFSLLYSSVLSTFDYLSLSIGFTLYIQSNQRTKLQAAESAEGILFFKAMAITNTSIVHILPTVHWLSIRSSLGILYLLLRYNGVGMIAFAFQNIRVSRVFYHCRFSNLCASD